MKYKAFLFDLDGTLILSDPYHFKAWNAFAQRYGRSITEEEYSRHITGKTNAAILDWFFEGKFMSKEEVDAMALDKERLYYELYAPDIRPLHGALGLMRQAKDAGIRLGIVTNGIPQNIEFLFTHVPIASLMDVTVSSADVQHGKPSPEPYLKAAERLGLCPADCLVFEDTPTGLKAALAAGMDSVALLSSYAQEDLPGAFLWVKHYEGLWERLSVQTG